MAGETLTGSSLHGSGHVTADGNLTVLLQENTDPDHEFGHPEFSLDAKRLVVETDHAEAMTMVGFRFIPNPQTTTHRYTDARVEGMQHREDYRFFLWPLGDTTITQENDVCLEGIPSQDSQILQHPILRYSRDANSTRTSDALQWTGCGDSRAMIQGDFLLRLWEWDAELYEGGDREFLPSGTRNAEGTPNDPDSSDIAGQGTEQFLYAYNATLTIPRLGGHHSVYVEDGQVAATGGLLLRGATGKLEVGDTVLAVDRQRVFVHGDLTMRTQAMGLTQPFSAVIDGQADHLEIDGQTVPLATEAPARTGSVSPASWILPIAAAILVAMVVLWSFPLLLSWRKGSKGFKQRRAEGFWRLAMRADDLGWKAVASWSARRAVQWNRDSIQYRIDLATYLSVQGKFKEALIEHGRAHRMIEGVDDHDSIALNAHFAAHAAAAADDLSVYDWMRVAYDHDASLWDDMEDDPVLARFLRQLSFLDRNNSWAHP